MLFSMEVLTTWHYCPRASLAGEEEFFWGNGNCNCKAVTGDQPWLEGHPQNTNPLPLQNTNTTQSLKKETSPQIEEGF